MYRRILIERSFMIKGIVLYLFVNVSGFSEVELHEHLFKKYNPNVIPLNGSQPVTVEIQMFPMLIQEIDEHTQTISLLAFLELRWTDTFLTWDREEYSNTTIINVKVKDIWRPDLSLQNSFNKPIDIINKEDTALISANGDVITWPYGVLQLPCTFKIRRFPFDDQTCDFDFASWTNPNDRIRLIAASSIPNFSSYSENGEWDLVNGTTTESGSSYLTQVWDHVSFKLHFRRKWLFVLMNVMVPVFCIGIINLCCYFLPPQSGERVTLCISLFLTLAVYITVVNGYLPQTSDEISAFGLFVGLQLVGSSFSIVSTNLSLNCFYNDRYFQNSKCITLLLKLTCSKQNLIYTRSNGINNNIPDTRENDDQKEETDSVQPACNHNRFVCGKDISVAIDKASFNISLVWYIIVSAFYITSLLVK